MQADESTKALLSRRKFFQSALMATAVAATGCASLSKSKENQAARVGSNIYGWGQYAQREKRALDAQEVMKALRDCGYDYLEGFMNVDAPAENERFASQLVQHGLRPTSLYVGPALHDATTASQTVKKVLVAAAKCSQAGFEILSCNPAPIGRQKTDAELKTQAAALNDLGQGLNDLGMKLGIHHHLPELASQGREFHHVFQNTDPTKVGWCYDVHWVWKGGLQPLDALRQYGSRVVTWHLRQSRDKIWWEVLDTGDINYEEVARYARKNHLAQFYTVELALEAGTKITRSAVENHCASREFVKKVFKV